MSEINYQALRLAAENATPGEWCADDYHGVIADAGLNANYYIASCSGPDNRANKRFIAAANPATVLALLASLEAAEKRIAELEARAFNPAILDVIAERQRQQSVEGWMPEHDDEHCNGELAMAAVCYINETGTVNRNGGKPWGWPWDASWWKPNARRRNLVKAGALILAEIERIDRAAGIGKGE